MSRRIHFISGLPRSGSTLLSAILNQNPRFSAGISSPLSHMFSTLQQLLSGKTEYHSLITDEKRRALLKGLVENYFADLPHDVVVFDTSRGWCSRLPALLALFPESRVICCVRQLSWIFDSFERLFHLNALEPSRMFNYDGGHNVYSRVDALNHSFAGVVGSSYSGLREAFYGPYGSHLLLVNYNTLAKEPLHTLESIYDFISERPYGHDFENVEFQSDEFDERLGVRGLHRVRGAVRAVERQTILPPDVFHRYAETDFWNNASQNPNKVLVL